MGRSATNGAVRGLYTLVPNGISLTPTPAVNANYTGLMDFTEDGNTMYLAESSGAVDTDTFDRVRSVNLNTMGVVGSSVIFGDEFNDDLKVNRNVLYITGRLMPVARGIHRYNAIGGSYVGSVPLPAGSPYRLAMLRTRNLIWIAGADLCKIIEYDIGTNTLLANFRVPLQISPMALAVSGGDRAVIALNAFSGTVNVIDVAAMKVATAPTYTLEAGNTLPGYRGDIIAAFSDLLGVLGQSLKDAFCDKFLIECQDCTDKDRIYLGTVDIQGRQVFHICNFNKRHYAKSFRTWGYWLSAVPILPLLKRAFAMFACKIF